MTLAELQRRTWWIHVENQDVLRHSLINRDAPWLFASAGVARAETQHAVRVRIVVDEPKKKGKVKR